jgi:hypothetical protein
MTLGPCENIVKRFLFTIYQCMRKLDCLSASLSSLVESLRGKPDPTPVKHLSGGPYFGWLRLTHKQ